MCPKRSLYIETNPGWLELPLVGTNFHGSKPVLATEVLLYVVTPHKNSLGRTVPIMMSHNIGFYGEIRKIYPQLIPITPSHLGLCKLRNFSA